jgi:glycosyltransferase involved in cell wall biosynthesis
MALGLPIVASDFPKWKSILDNKPCALYVNPESPKDIADKMKMLIENQELREKLGKAAKENSKKYSWNSVAKRLLDFYNRVFND